MNDDRDGTLSRALGLFPTSNIVIANMIGAGIFTTSGLLIADLGNPVLMIILWIGGGILALCGAFCYGELGSAMPEAGGEYLFLSRLYHPMLGFLSGWVSFFVGFSAPIAASSLGCGEYLASAFPQIIELGPPAVVKKSIAILVVLLFTLIHLRGINVGATVQNYLTLMKVVLIVALIFAGFSSGRGDFGSFLQGEPVSFDFAGWKVMGLSLMWIMFSYSGWNASAYIGSEIKNPARNLPLSLLLGTGLVILLYLLLNVLFIYAIPHGEMDGVIAVGGLAGRYLFSESLERIISVLISFALFSSISAFIILGPRVYYAMAKDGYFFKIAAEVHPVFRVPSKSIIIQGLIAGILVVTGTFDQILTYMGFSLGIFPIIAVIGVFKLRREKSGGFRMPLYPVVPLAYVLVSVSILVLAYFERPVESSIAILTVLAGVPLYYYFSRSR